ncbi:MAG TPA: methyltransferase domain-containing protein [Planctomycetota bacterium]|jgi:ubiquinone/menaquinone biosynthesis C-methylase UbiE|nr:methyltransferase domain-containing protein [Planctomycetota bacterium]
MPEIYQKQKEFFRQAYETGRHGWPEVGPTPHVVRWVRKLGPGRGRTALDLGSGEGRHTILLARHRYDVTALDLEPLALRKASSQVRHAGLQARFVVGDALNLNFADASFDLVLDYGCFHHVVTRDWARYRRGIARILKPRGHLILSVFSMKFRHSPDEKRTRNWLVHRNHYDHFFTRTEIRGAFAPDFELRGVQEELDGLNGFLHALLKKI